MPSFVLYLKSVVILVSLAGIWILQGDTFCLHVVFQSVCLGTRLTEKIGTSGFAILEKKALEIAAGSGNASGTSWWRKTWNEGQGNETIFLGPDMPDILLMEVKSVSYHETTMTTLPETNI